MLRCHSGCVVQSAAQAGQIAPGLGGDALVPVAVRTDGCHVVELAEAAAVVPGHGGHVVAAAHARLQVLGDARCWGAEESERPFKECVLSNCLCDSLPARGHQGSRLMMILKIVSRLSFLVWPLTDFF